MTSLRHDKEGNLVFFLNTKNLRIVTMMVLAYMVVQNIGKNGEAYIDYRWYSKSV